MLDLFSPIVEVDKQHANFVTLLSPSYEFARNEILKWTEGFIDRDNKIINEFQTTFNSSFWEFYLNACFKQLKFNIDYTKSRPDFLLEKEGSSIVAEAVISSHPEGGTPEWERSFPKEFTLELWNQIIHLSTIRLANSILSKHKKYIEEYKDLEHVKERPYIICVSPFDQPFFFQQADNAIRRVLYKFSTPLYIKNEYDNSFTIVGEEYVDKVIKHNETEINLGFFTDDRMKEVSAIIFSNTATLTKAKAIQSSNHPETVFFATRYKADSFESPYVICEIGGKYKESLLDGLHIFLNPFAEHPFDPNLFYGDEIILHYYDGVDKSPLTFANDGALISHGCTSAVKKEDLPHIKKEKSTQVYSDYSFTWKEGKLYEVNARVGLGINNHLAHYYGWTIAVFMDIIDKDWGFAAKKKIVYTMREFLTISHEVKNIYQGDFYETKEKAFSVIKRIIDERVLKKKKISKMKKTKAEIRKIERTNRKNMRNKRRKK